MVNYKMTIQYEGTRYRGWQKQPGVENTIQGKLETLLSRLMEEPIEVYGAGRTDAGVHALGQVASFRVPEEKLRLLQHGGADAGQGDILPSRLREAEDAALFAALNHYLPEDIAVVRLVRASDRFHARYLTASKWYQYRIRTSPVSDVRNRRFLWQYGGPLDTVKMAEGAKLLTGCHDFASFCGLKMKKSTVRTVSRIEITQPDEDTVVLDYYGDGFLNHMVRLMTGELVEVGAGRMEPDEIGRILSECRKGAADRTAPASGLTLMEVNY
ncbi:MAG TPA: tRNA pseudouridine(38-40) synthase TruA [Lachnospiraceae bacterium]|nr:tRNA pseudouridine(38-40) synthase TruA [Lachnospiraceae bacterium]